MSVKREKKRESKRNQFLRSFFWNNSPLKDVKKYLFCKQTHLSIPLITTSPMFSRAGTSHSLPQRAPSIQLSKVSPEVGVNFDETTSSGGLRSRSLPCTDRTEKKNRSRNTFARIDSPHTAQQLRFHLRRSNFLINRLVRSWSTKRIKRKKIPLPLFQKFKKRIDIHPWSPIINNLID